MSWLALNALPIAAWLARVAFKRDWPGTRFLDRMPDPAKLLKRLRRIRRPRRRERGGHRKPARPFRVEFGTGTLPRVKVDGHPPWNTAELPVLREVQR